ncbi:hypothetical protein IPM44_04460 [bacterium]|nr:MAG: hypothetical protein IPM44_04460 [bacterium]
MLVPVGVEIETGRREKAEIGLEGVVRLEVLEVGGVGGSGGSTTSCSMVPV